MNVKDSTGMSLADHLAPGTGVIVAQSPGTAQSFIDSIQDVFPKRNIKQTYIALDADGATNLSVAKGIHYAYDTLGQHATTHVLTWDINKGKGLDDLILGVMNPANQRTFRDIGLDRGTAEQLYPLNKATENIPYSLDGTRSYSGQVEWQQQYEQDANDAYIREQLAKGNNTVLGDDITNLLGGQNTKPVTPTNNKSIFDQISSDAISSLPSAEKPSQQSLIQKIIQGVKQNKQETETKEAPKSLFDEQNKQEPATKESPKSLFADDTSVVKSAEQANPSPQQSLFGEVSSTSTPTQTSLFEQATQPVQPVQQVQQVQPIQQVQSVQNVQQPVQQVQNVQQPVQPVQDVSQPVQIDALRKLVTNVTIEVASKVVPIVVQQTLEQVTPEVIQQSVESALLEDQSFINAVTSLNNQQHTL